MTLDEKLTRLRDRLSHLDRVAVAFSGGVDSTLLLKVACDTLGVGQVVALTAATQLVPRREQDEARDMAAMLGVHHVIVEEDVLRHETVSANRRDRCYHCKRHIFTLFRERLPGLRCEHLLDGTNLDDLGEDRPGLRALSELGVLSPLAESALGKADVRALSRRFGLPTAERPSFACLASRIPFGTPLTAENLARVEKCEDYLQQLGLGNFRVRCHDNLARLELDPSDMALLLNEQRRHELVARFSEYGFTYVTLDLKGFRSGSMSEAES